jgi:uncharacterized Tic20 family protein
MEEEPSAPATPTPTKEERTWALVAHLGSAVAALVSAGVLSVVLPLVIYLAKRDESEFVGSQAKESLNFRITLLIGYLLCVPLFFVGVGLCLWPLIWLVDLIFGIIAGMKAYDGESYRYPFAIRLVD